MMHDQLNSCLQMAALVEAISLANSHQPSECTFKYNQLERPCILSILGH